jgi:hypothetical protein
MNTFIWLFAVLILFSINGSINASQASISELNQTDFCFDEGENRPRQCTPDESLEFYEYMGEEWMKQKKSEMLVSMKKGYFHDWIDSTDNHYHWNVYQYYSYTEDLPKLMVGSPYSQLYHGTAPSNIVCKDNLVLILKHTEMPACVQHQTKARLIDIGWAKIQVNVHDDAVFIDATKKLPEVKSFLAMHPDATIRIDRESYVVTYEEYGLRKHPTSTVINHTKSLMVGLDYEGKPVAIFAECGGPISMIGTIDLLNDPDWCFPIDQTDLVNSLILNDDKKVP